MSQGCCKCRHRKICPDTKCLWFQYMCQRSLVFLFDFCFRPFVVGPTSDLLCKDLFWLLFPPSSLVFFLFFFSCSEGLAQKVLRSKGKSFRSWTIHVLESTGSQGRNPSAFVYYFCPRDCSPGNYFGITQILSCTCGCCLRKISSTSRGWRWTDCKVCMDAFQSRLVFPVSYFITIFRENLVFYIFYWKTLSCKVIHTVQRVLLRIIRPSAVQFHRESDFTDITKALSCVVHHYWSVRVNQSFSIIFFRCIRN